MAVLTWIAGVLGAVCLVIALFLPGEPKCTGLHCSGCKRH